jgi:hypothetical protein
MKIKTAIIILFVLFGLVWKYFFYLDPFNGCFIVIYPSWLEFSNTSMKNAIKVLKRTSTDDYQEMCLNVTSINPNISCGGFGGGCFYADQPQSIDISTTNRSLAITASIIIHETCHVMQFKEGRGISEPECDQKMAQALGRIVEY